MKKDCLQSDKAIRNLLHQVRIGLQEDERSFRSRCGVLFYIVREKRRN
jgi:hypothetical protein